MPNWVYNKLSVLGRKEDVDAFVDKARGQAAIYPESRNTQHVRELTFNSFLPVPEEVLKAGYSTTGYDWQRANWGGKWDAGSVHVDRYADTHVMYTYETAWSPSDRVLTAMVEQHPELVLVNSWQEEDNCLGRLHGYLGVVLETLNERYTYEGPSYEDWCKMRGYDPEGWEHENAYLEVCSAGSFAYYNGHEAFSSDTYQKLHADHQPADGLTVDLHRYAKHERVLKWTDILRNAYRMNDRPALIKTMHAISYHRGAYVKAWEWLLSAYKNYEWGDVARACNRLENPGHEHT
jgi:hypothetical protein